MEEKVTKTIYLEKNLFDYVESKPGKNFQKRLEFILQKNFEMDEKFIMYLPDGQCKILNPDAVVVYHWSDDTHQGKYIQKVISTLPALRGNRPPSKKFVDEVLNVLDSGGYKTEIVDEIENENLKIFEIWACKKQVSQNILDGVREKLEEVLKVL